MDKSATTTGEFSDKVGSVRTFQVARVISFFGHGVLLVFFWPLSGIAKQRNMVLLLEEAQKMINVRYFKLLMNVFHYTPAVTCALSLDIYSGKHFLLYLAFFESI